MRLCLTLTTFRLYFKGKHRSTACKDRWLSENTVTVLLENNVRADVFCKVRTSLIEQTPGCKQYSPHEMWLMSLAWRLIGFHLSVTTWRGSLVGTSASPTSKQLTTENNITPTSGSLKELY